MPRWALVKLQPFIVDVLGSRHRGDSQRQSRPLVADGQGNGVSISRQAFVLPGLLPLPLGGGGLIARFGHDQVIGPVSLPLFGYWEQAGV